MSERCDECPRIDSCLEETESCSALSEARDDLLEIIEKLGDPPKRENPRVTPEEMRCIEELCDENTPCEKLCGRLGLVYCCLK